ncbi:ABC transporter ATP-binding protein [Aestuariimicrobium ganziense]|uniref:ABC transporter ATP-binding protein n=1 Tax=Aestuariimicrobium ganziense TaxID=2773677 RepID=UPI001941984E|nr:ABC transporter ATP-binding protein [Aestuariimicrobium ganziense]
MTTGLQLEGLHKELGGRTIVENLSLDVATGELVCLLGPSGCGKTTTLRMIAGFLEPESGRVVVAGHDVTSLPPEKRPSAMVFQNYALWPHMTVTKNVAFPLRLAKRPRAEIAERVAKVLELVNLTHHKDSRPGRISGGEQQRTALARALVQEPAVLLLDEPLSNLDAKLRVRVREDIREIQQRLGITTVMVTHDQDEAMAMADRIAVMNDGRIEQVSSPQELYSDPQTEFVATFVGSLNKVEGRLEPHGLTPEAGLTSAIRPEAVAVVPASSDGALDAEVVRVTPHGHFAEVKVKTLGEVELVSFVTGPPPAEGDQVGVRLGEVWRFRDGKRVR